MQIDFFNDTNDKIGIYYAFYPKPDRMETFIPAQTKKIIVIPKGIIKYMVGIMLNDEDMIPRCFVSSVKLAVINEKNDNKQQYFWKINFDPLIGLPDVPEDTKLWFFKWSKSKYNRSKRLRREYLEKNNQLSDVNSSTLQEKQDIPEKHQYIDSMYDYLAQEFVLESFTQIPPEYLAIIYIENEGDEVTWERVKELSDAYRYKQDIKFALLPAEIMSTPQFQETHVLDR